MENNIWEKLEALTPAKRALLFEAMRKEAVLKDQSGTTKAIRRRWQQGSAPLSFAQQRLWFIEQLAPGNATYNIPLSVRLSGNLNTIALQRSFQQVVQRHEILRTRFVGEEGEPRQIVYAATPLSLPIIDLSDLPEPERQAETQQMAIAEAARPFDLSTGPLLRAMLLRLSATEHLALLTMHHIVSDGWSMSVFLREVAAFYEAFVAGHEPSLPELPIQYADYAVWQKEWMQGEVLETQLSYWKEQLAGAPEYLELPADFERPAVQKFNGAFETFTLTPELSKQIKDLSRSEGATLFMTLLAAFKTLLYRYSWQEDIVVGTGIANRKQQEVEQLIGFFINMLVLRTNFRGNPDFRQLLARVRKTAVDAYAHQDLPFERLVEELQPERDLSRQPLFQVVFVLRNMPMPAMELAGVKLTPQQVDSGTTTFDLHLTMEESANGALAGTLEYSTDLFTSATVTGMLKNFIALLEVIVVHPEWPILDIPIPADDQSRAEGTSTQQQASVANMYETDQFLFQWGSDPI